MHVLILTGVYPPEVRSASHVMFELAETLHRFGHKITVLTALQPEYTPKTNRMIDRFYDKTCENGIDVIRFSTLPVHRVNAPAVIRGMGQILNAIAFFSISLFLKRVDASISYSPPLTLGFTGYLLYLTKKIPHIFNLQDLVPQYAIDLGILTNKKLIKLIKMIEHFIYKRVQYITVHSQGNKDYVVNEGFDPDKVKVVPNWVDTSQIVPTAKDNSFRRDNNLEGKFVVTFAGVLGFAQDLDTVVDAGLYLKEYQDIVLLIVGEGVEKERLIDKTNNQGIKNIVFHRFVSKEEYPKVVAASDICLATLQKDLKCPVIPSKILGYMSGGRPVITSLSLEGDAPLVIKNADCGICVEPGKPDKLAAAIMEAYNDRNRTESWGGNGREYITKFHGREACIRLYDNLLKAVAN